MRLAFEQPDWVPVLQAACEQARASEPYGGEFAGSWVLRKLEELTGQPSWRPGLRLLVGYGLIEKSGESTRGGRRAYYRMPDREGVCLALDELSVVVRQTDLDTEVPSG
jgi:hypothetical protein